MRELMTGMREERAEATRVAAVVAAARVTAADLFHARLLAAVELERCDTRDALGGRLAEKPGGWIAIRLRLGLAREHPPTPARIQAQLGRARAGEGRPQHLEGHGPGAEHASSGVLQHRAAGGQFV